jgi:hypothetical protein
VGEGRARLEGGLVVLWNCHCHVGLALGTGLVRGFQLEGAVVDVGRPAQPHRLRGWKRVHKFINVISDH